MNTSRRILQYQVAEGELELQRLKLVCRAVEVARILVKNFAGVYICSDLTVARQFDNWAHPPTTTTIPGQELDDKMCHRLYGNLFEAVRITDFALATATVVPGFLLIQFKPRLSDGALQLRIPESMLDMTDSEIVVEERKQLQALDNETQRNRFNFAQENNITVGALSMQEINQISEDTENFRFSARTLESQVTALQNKSE